MSHRIHELHDEFPEDRALLHSLKLNDGHFQNVSQQYHEVNGEIHRIETEVEFASDERLEDLKKQRLTLLDEVSKILTRARTEAG